jgi:hypothetical protein
VPIFPELRSFLDNAYSMAQEGETWVVPMLGGNIKKNIGTRFKKIIKRAGVEVWPKPSNLNIGCRLTTPQLLYQSE